MKTSRVMLIAAILLALMVGCVCGQDITAVGTYNANNTKVIVSDTSIQFQDTLHGLSISSTAKIDGSEVASIVGAPFTRQMAKTRMLTEEETPIATDDVHFTYVLSPNQLKETVVLDAQHDLSFPITVPDGYKLIPINGGDWRIASNNISVFDGITISKPFGTDSDGKSITMDYELTDVNTLSLVYSQDSISYPLTIDPTYTASDTFVDPAGVQHVDITLRGSGGGGGTSGSLYTHGDGGVGGSLTTQSLVSVTPGNSYPIVVGDAGTATYPNGGAGGSTTGFGYTATGGTGGTGLVANAGDGGTGGNGGTVGSPGVKGSDGNGGYTGGAPGTGGGSGGGGGASSTTGVFGGIGGTGGVIVYYLLPSPTFTPTGPLTGVSPLGQLFTDTTASLTAWTWEVNNVTGNNTWVTVNSSKNAYITLLTGNWTVRMTGTNAYGFATSAQTTWMNVSAPVVTPVASFTQNVTVGYAPATVLLTDTSTNTPTTWNWGAKNLTPGNNTWFRIDTNKNPVDTFGYGNWSLNLTATNAGGSNISTQVSWLNVSFAPAISDFTITNPIVVTGASVTVTPLGSDGTFYNTSWGDGAWSNATTNAAKTHSFTGPQIFSPSLYVFKTGAAVNITTKSEAIGVDCMKYYPTTDGYVSRTTSAAWSTIRAGAGTSVDSSATSAYARQTATSSASTYSTFDRRIEIYNENANPVPGSYTINNASLNEYGNSHSSTFSTNPNLVVMNISSLASLDSITSSDYNKFGTTSLSNSNITYASYNDAGYNRLYLNTNGINLIRSYPGKIPFMLMTSWDADNASPTWSSTKTAYFRPFTSEQAGTTQDPFLLVNFSASPVYFTVNTTVGLIGANGFQFNDTSPSDGGTYNWSFGDGTYSAIRNATHTYTSQGLYTVIYTTPIGGSSLTQANLINISAPSFYCDAPLSGGLPFTVTCHDSSAVLTGDTHWIWGDGSSSDGTGTPILHTYTVAGDYDVQMRSPSATGDIVTNTNYVHAGVFTPGASFTSNVTSVAAGGYVSFTDLSTNTPTSWKWSFNGGTGSDSTSQNPIYQFNTVGNFSVNETATNGAGSNSLVKSNYIRVYPAGWTPGMVPITAASISLGVNYSYGNQGYNPLFLSTVTGSAPHTYAWNFGDGGTSTAAQPQHAFNTVGTFPVQLNVSNAISYYMVNLSDSIVIYGAGIPYANFIAQPTSGTPGVLVNFVDLSLHGNTTGQVCNWSFGDIGYTLAPYSSICGGVTHVYGYAGVYDVNYSITNFNGSSYMLRQQYITVSTNQQTQTTFYSPHQVAIQILDANNVPIANTLVTANGIETTLPGGTSGALATLQASYGIPLAEAQKMLNASTIYSGHTDSNGYVAVLMLSTIGYDVSAIDTNGVPYTLTLYPQGVYYQMKTPNATTTSIFNAAATSNAVMKDSMYISNFSEPNTSYSTMSDYVYDSSGKTAGANCFWRLVDNGTVWWDNQTWALGSGLKVFTKTVPHVPYQQWKWGCETT